MRYAMWALGALATAALCSPFAAAQEVVHALSGTVVKVDPAAKTLQVTTNDGSEGLFAFASQTSKTQVNFDRNVQGRVTPITSYSKPNEQVVVYFYGNGTERTAVAVQDLGAGPFDTVEGTVTKFNKHTHEITVKPATGQEQTFAIGPKAMADSMEGAVPGDRFAASKGDNVRVIAEKGNGTETALFIRD